jgi:hypothetical protein
MGVGALRIRGVVRRGGEPLEGAYVTLNQDESFIAERRTGPDGVYEFHTTPGEWVLVCRAAGADGERRVVVQGDPGDLAVDFEL